MLLKVLTPENPPRVELFDNLPNVAFRRLDALGGRQGLNAHNEAIVYDLTGDELRDDDIAVWLGRNDDDIPTWAIVRPGWAFIMNDDGKTIDRI